KLCLSVFEPMIATATILKDNMLTASKKGFINATDLADYLVKKGMPFRSAYKLVGETVAYCIANNTVLDDLPFEKYAELSELFEEDVYTEISLETCVNKRISAGSTGPASVEAQIDYITEFLKND
ncbi:MAG: argininosuccinate lyase, partial [Ruminococcus sp.]|nr:argininosuccinate lyase [Ruminococcus sp.]